MDAEQTKNLELSKAAFQAIESLLPTSARKDIYQFIFEYNEWGLGVETIISVILEDQIAIDNTQKKKIDLAANAMGINRGQDKIEIK